MKDDLISNFADATHTKPYIEGKDIEAYKIERIRYLEWGTNRSPALLRRPTFPELYIYPKIMMGSMTSGIYDDTGLVSNHSVLISTKWDNLALVDNKSINMSIGKYYGVKGDDIQAIKDDLILNSKDFNIKYCLSILNSSFAKRFFETIGRSGVGLYPDDIKKLPIKKIPLQEQEVFADKVDEIMELKKDLLNQDTLALEKELDDMVTNLYKE
ncbi:TaqI-like C-terminal specificity domain-containing protein [Halarcobacter sp.]|uniref:TaqI-like C-terminal specificity domain-containing protein n=1 Tax=Halarcobacter sp. TaxID=2321133 RepID=UPI002AABCFE6|nr:TaqI-like C-terminal specificity domain-containing protein [Halarcobacter sp.]